MDKKNLVKKDSDYSREKQAGNSRYLNIIEKMLESLSPRSKEIVRKRFGLVAQKPETLEKIGKFYGITRERVRQIISEAIKNLSSKFDEADFLEAEKEILLSIEKKDGIIMESEIVKIFGREDSREINAIRFFSDCSKKIHKTSEKGTIEKSWSASKEVIEEVKKILEEAKKIIEKEQKLLEDKEIAIKLQEIAPDFTPEKILNYLKISSEIKKNRFGKWGLSHWMEVNPKGTKEKVHLVLTHSKKPLHFKEIAKLIDEYALGKRKAHPQTVHNELIKNDKFVLIGRGIYALREWGYSEGTIKDVIKNILEKNSKPLDKEKIMEEVLKVRKVKKTTIMINLNNGNFFEKLGELYALKK